MHKKQNHCTELFIIKSLKAVLLTWYPGKEQIKIAPICSEISILLQFIDCIKQFSYLFFIKSNFVFGKIGAHVFRFA